MWARNRATIQQVLKKKIASGTVKLAGPFEKRAPASAHFYASGGSVFVYMHTPGGTPYNGLYGEAPPKGGPFSGVRYIKG